MGMRAKKSRRQFGLGLLAAAMALVPLLAQAQEPAPDVVGRVERTVPDAVIHRGDQAISAEPGAAIFLNDRIETGDAARLLIRFADGSKVTLGSQSDLVIDRYVYDPAAKSHIALELAKGALRFVSGAIGESREKDVTIEHPAASLGVRGTDFWMGDIDTAFSVLLLEGAVEVRTDADAVILNDPGEGVAVPSRTEAPGAVKIWPGEKVQRALAMVAF